MVCSMIGAGRVARTVITPVSVEMTKIRSVISSLLRSRFSIAVMFDSFLKGLVGLEDKQEPADQDQGAARDDVDAHLDAELQ